MLTIMCQVLFICQIFYATGISLAKLSIVALYLRIFPNRVFYRIILATSFVIVAMWICSILVTIFQVKLLKMANT